MPIRSQIAAAYVGLAVLLLATSRTLQLIAVGVLLLVGGWVLWTTQQALVAMQRQNRATEEANHQLRASIAQVEELAIEQERIRLAREMHDGLGHHLNNVKVYVSIARRAFEVDPAAARASLTTAKAEIANAQRELRRAIDALVSEECCAGVLEEMLEGPVRDCTLAGVAVDFEVHGTPRPLPQPTKHELYRIAQEALTNICRHSRATWAALHLDYQQQLIRLVVEDNGVGMPTVERRRGHGLDNLQERAALIAGKADIETCPGKGVRITVEVPV